MPERVLRKIGRNPSHSSVSAGSETEAPRIRNFLERQGIEAMYPEISDQRSIYVMTALNEAGGVGALYRDIFGEV